MKIYIEGLGSVCLMKDTNKIKWYLSKQLHRLHKRKATRIYLDLHEQYFDMLIEEEYYEIAAIIRSRLSDRQIKTGKNGKPKNLF